MKVAGFSNGHGQGLPLLMRGELGKAVGTSGDIIGKYERNEVKPSVEVAAKIADVLEVSLDYLVGKTSVEVDAKTLRRLQDIQKLGNKTAPPCRGWWTPS